MSLRVLDYRVLIHKMFVFVKEDPKKCLRQLDRSAYHFWKWCESKLLSVHLYAIFRPIVETTFWCWIADADNTLTWGTVEDLSNPLVVRAACHVPRFSGAGATDYQFVFRFTFHHCSIAQFEIGTANDYNRKYYFCFTFDFIYYVTSGSL